MGVEIKARLIMLVTILLCITLIMGCYQCHGENLSSSGEPEWQMEFGDSSHQSRSDFDENSFNGTLMWKRSVGKDIDLDMPSTVVIGKDGTLYIHTLSGELVAIDGDRKQMWSHDTNMNKVNVGSSTPAIGSDGTIYVPRVNVESIHLGESSYREEYSFAVEALDESGRTIWNTNIYNDVPIFSDITGITLGRSGEIYLLVKRTVLVSLWGYHDVTDLYSLSPDGGIEWDLTFKGESDSLPAVGEDGTVYFGTMESIEALNPDGSVRWNLSVPSGASSPPAVDGGNIYFGSYDKNLNSISSNGSLNWRFRTGGWVVACPAIDQEGRIVVGSEDGTVYCLDPNGTEIWSYDVGRPITGITLDSSGRSLISSRSNPLITLDPDGNELWRYSTGTYRYSAASIDDRGTVFIYDDEANLHALGPSGPDSPQSLIAITTQDGIYLRWALPSNDGSAPVESIRIYRADGVTKEMGTNEIRSRMRLLVTISPDETAYIDDVDIDTGYAYSLEAVNPYGYSFTNPVYAGDEFGQFIYMDDQGSEIEEDVLFGAGLFLLFPIVGLIAATVVCSLDKKQRPGQTVIGGLSVVKGLLLSPFRTFDSLRELTLGPCILYLMVWASISFSLAALMIPVTGDASPLLPLIDMLGVTTIGGTIGMLIGLVLFIVPLVLVIIGFVHAGCKVMGGTGDYEETAKAIILGGIPGYMFGWIPFLILVPTAWTIIVMIIGLSRLHRFFVEKAIASMVISFVLIFVVTFIIFGFPFF
jgi:outer membrane protein assembly factor BamB